jgi:hypothetical protein
MTICDLENAMNNKYNKKQMKTNYPPTGWQFCRSCRAFRNGCGRVERRSGMCCRPLPSPPQSNKMDVAASTAAIQND